MEQHQQVWQPPLRVIDALMGTGKSVWLAKYIIEAIHKSNERFVIVLPRITELERYESLLAEVSGLVSLSEAGNKKGRFSDALSDAQVILITHALFEEHLALDTFDICREGEWSLAIDEVPSIFEPIKTVTGTDIDGLISKDVLKKEMVTDEVGTCQ